jgi:glycosyltransferase involved in cell wall biosynthesis
MELIVVDNNSADRTLQIARRLADVVEERGPERSAQRNHGAAIAKGQYLLFIDSDMILEPGVVTNCVAVATNTSASAVIIPEVTFGEGVWARCRALERSCYSGDDLVEAARFFSRTVFEEAGGYDESLIGGEDWDLNARVARGERLPRADSRIFHDEGYLRLKAHLEKKRYYANSLGQYWAKNPKLAMRQFNIVGRRAFVRNWRRLLQHPFLTSCLLLLKSLELAISIPVVIRPANRVERDRRT